MSNVDKQEMLHLQIAHSYDKYNLSIPASDAGEPASIKLLHVLIEQLTQVPAVRQKLICKGQVLTDYEKPLAYYNIRSGSKILVIGEKFKKDNDENMKFMLVVEKNLDKINLELDETMHDFDGIHRGFLPVEHLPAALKQLRKKMTCVVDKLSKQLENLDTLVLSEQADMVRKRRKCLVDRIHNLLARCDDVDEGLANQNARYSLVKDCLKS